MLLTWLGLAPLQARPPGIACCIWLPSAHACTARPHLLACPSRQIMLTVTTCFEAVLSMPSDNPDAGAMLLHERLQKFAW